MASIRKEIVIEAPLESVWDAVRDVGAVHKRQAPGLVVNTRLEDDVRIVTFASGLVLRELIVTIDDQARRLVWAAVGGQIKHHNGSKQVFDAGNGRSRLVWITDILPHDLAEMAGPIMEEGLRLAKELLEREAKGA